MTVGILPHYFYKNPSYWQAVLDLAFEQEHADGPDALELSDYVDDFAGLKPVVLQYRLRQFFEHGFEVQPTPHLTVSQRETMINEIIADWLETASRDDIYEVLTREDRYGLVGPKTGDQELVGMWANLGNRCLPDVDGNFK